MTLSATDPTDHDPNAKAGDRTRERLARIEAERMAAGLCRHCGGLLPCWSQFGDRGLGKRHTRKSLASLNAFVRKLDHAS